jgi:hypothetical protein
MGKERRRRTPGGAGAMKKKGMKQVQVWLDAAEHDEIGLAARRFGVPLATFIRKVAEDVAYTSNHGHPTFLDSILSDYWKRER